MTAYEWTQVELQCNAPRCHVKFEGERGLRPSSGETAAMVRKRAVKAGWTHVPRKIGRHRYDSDFCPEHKPAKADGAAQAPGTEG